MTSALQRGTAFLFGMGFALLPAIGPFLAVLLFISSQFRARRSDAVWAVIALLYSIPAAMAGDASIAAAGLLQLAAGWLLYRAFAHVSRRGMFSLRSNAIGLGLLVGLGLFIGLSVLRIEAWNFATAKTIAQAIVWEASPALFGHTVLVLGGLIAIVGRSPAVRFGALGLSAAGILVSGSREAAIGWLVVALVTTFSRPRSSRRGRIAELVVIATMVGVATGLGPLFGWGQVGFLLQAESASETGNLLQGTEVPYGDWWDTSWVSVTADEAVLAGDPTTVYLVRKSESDSWLRLQQAVRLEPATRYSVSAWIRDDGTDAQPGIQGWGQVADGETRSTFVLVGSWTDGHWRARVRGPGTLVDAGVAARDGPWHRVYATFEYAGDRPLSWFVGLVPDARRLAGATTAFAGFQLERGEPTPYVPGSATRGLGLAVARLPYWQAAWEGILERPVLGWGAGAFSDRFVQGGSDRSRLHVVPAHPHNLFLHVAFERGLLGAVAILLLAAALTANALVRKDLQLAALIGAVLFVNLFDTTLLYGGVFYPLVAIAGWRAGTSRVAPDDRARAVRPVAARLGLAVADVAAAGAAMILAHLLAGAPGLAVAEGAASSGDTWGVLYALLLWPVLSWRENLYPGYGQTPQQELKKQATVALYAGLLLTAIAVLLPSYVPLSAPVAMLAGVLSLATLPAGRSLAKRALYAMSAWGRPVIVLGAGDTGHRIVRGLRRTPLDGLHPVAFFDDDAALAGRHVHGVPVAGALRDADAWAGERHVGHAIVAIPSLGTDRLRDLLDTRRRQFRIVQYVPSLAGLPAEDVRASNLDGMLAIEVRNNLSSTRNRAVKRAIDLVVGTLGLALLAPVLLALGAWIRVDSRGPVLYRSSRVGEGGAVFPCIKFRTMASDAEAHLETLMSEDAAVREEYERFHKLEDDPRVTRVGRFLRRYSLDELPQLVNVVIGQMSLVGPRPYLTVELPMLAENGDVILQAKPGMTGYWQVSERNEVTFMERVEMEAHYVRNWSIWWDIVILARTLPAVLEKRGK